jgi:hypothetical protein
LIPVASTRSTDGEPALIDWLLLDAPLQHLREGDDRWRLRITVNGDSFLLDQNVPLWLRGLKAGSNAVVLELLDRAGQPLNPPFNSVVQEVVLKPGRPIGWQQESLSPDDLERWLGLSPATQEAPAAPTPPTPPREPDAPQEASGALESPPPAEPPKPAAAPESLQPEEQQRPLETVQPKPLPSVPLKAQPVPVGAASSPRVEPMEPIAKAAAEAIPDVMIPIGSGTEAAAAAPKAAQDPAPITTPTPSPTADSGEAAPVRARDLVNPDGSLVKPRPPGLLDRVRARFRG